jgi:hypothetical protein
MVSASSSPLFWNVRRWESWQKGRLRLRQPARGYSQWHRWVETQRCHWHRQMKLSGVSDTAEPKLAGVTDTAESEKTPLSQSVSVVWALIFFKWRIIKNPTNGELYYPRYSREQLKNWGLPKEFYLTQRCQWHRWVDFEFEYLGEFAADWGKIFMCESEAYGEMFDEKNCRSKISWDCPFKGLFCIIKEVNFLT